MTVVSCSIGSRKPVESGTEFGAFGPYEEIRGTFAFAVDPRHPDHAVITDIGLAPTAADGQVHFESDFILLKPSRPGVTTSLLYDVLNRGNRTALTTLNDADGDRGPIVNIGNGFLQRHGFSVLFCGWQHDVPAGLEIRVPEALAEGQRIRGQAFIQWQLTKQAESLLLSDAGHRPLSAVDLDEPGAILSVRPHPDGTPEIIERSRWRFAKPEGGRVTADAAYVSLEGGFQPGLVYEITYTTEGAPVIGLGFLAMRDSVSFLRYASEADGNPEAGALDRAYSFGRSQTGRYQREFMYLGLNRDEAERVVFDGMLIHTGSSRRGEFNVRFGQPSTNIMRSPSMLFPTQYGEHTDPVTGRTGGLLTRLRQRNAMPKVIATNTCVEYWWSGASLAHTDVEGTVDVPPPPDVRIYHLAGTQHGQGSLPLSDRTTTPDGARLEFPLNTIDYRPLLRRALINLDGWVRRGVEPPPSVYPRIADRTAVRREELEGAFAGIGVRLPEALPIRKRLDFGPRADEGILEYPPKEGPAFGTVVSAVDGDVNEIGGLRPLDLRVPLATYTGWTRRHADIGAAGHFIPLLGATHLFPRTAQQRKERHDPRPSLEERYASREDYLVKVQAAAVEMVAEGVLLEEDVDHLVRQAGARYDAFTAAQP